MTLLTCHIENFGKLVDFDMDFNKGLNIVNEPNGFGKSTLTVFLRVMFYGFEGESRRDILSNERKAYKPWGQGTYGGSIVFEKEGRSYLLTRIFGNKASEDIFRLQDADTLFDSRDFSENIGFELFGIDADGFKRSIVIHQGCCETGVDGAINAKICDLAEVTDDIGNFSEVENVFKKKLDGLSDKRRTGSRYKLNSEIYELEYKLKECGKLSSEIDAAKQNIRLSEENIGKLKADKANEEALIEKAVADVSYYYQREQYNQALKEYNDLNNEIISLEDKLINVPVKTEFKVQMPPSKKTAVIACIFMFVMLICILLICNTNLNENILWATAIATGLACLFIVFLPRRVISDTLPENADLLVSMHADKKKKRSELEKYISKIEKSSEFQKISEAREADEKTLELTKKKIEKISEAIENQQSKISECKVMLAGLERDYSEINRIKDVLADKKAELEKQNRQYFLLSTASEMLESAKNTFSAQLREPVSNSFKKFYNLLDDENKVEYSFDADTNLMAYSGGMYHSAECLSRGQRDLAGVAFRMALTETMFKDEKPFLIMDDPFVNLDDGRFAQADKLLTDISKQYQVIYFTCSAHRIPNIDNA